MQPCAELRLAAKTCQRGVHFHEHLLRHVFGSVMVADEAVRDVVRVLHVALHQNAKRITVAVLRVLYKVLVALFRSDVGNRHENPEYYCSY